MSAVNPGDRPDSLTLGAFSFTPDYESEIADRDREIVTLKREVAALTARIEAIERELSGSWLARLTGIRVRKRIDPS
jgi:hypothetical protein